MFRNLTIYRLTENIEFDANALQAMLAEKPARACANQELNTYGFVAPIAKGEDAPLVHVSSGFIQIACRKEERILPSSVVKDALAEKLEQIETEQQRKVYKKERDQLKDEIIQAFLPRAFVRRDTTQAAIMPQQGLILVNTSSSKKAEDLLSTLRDVMGTLPVVPMRTKLAPSTTMTDWIRTQSATGDFTLLDSALLEDTCEGGGKIVATGQDLTSAEIQALLATGMRVTQLSLAWQDKLTFVLDDALVIKGLKFSDLLQEQAAKDGDDNDLLQADASFTLMMLTLVQFIPALAEALGGVDQ